MELLITAVIIAIIVLFLADVALYTLYTVRHPLWLCLVYGRLHRRRKSILSLPGEGYRRVRGSLVEYLVGSPDHLELSDRQRGDSALREEYGERDVTERYDI
jgi:hypothetical protein